MGPRFACIATSRRRRALASPLSASTVRVRRASASLRRIAALGTAAIAPEARAWLPRADLPVAGPEHSSRR
jgi:hypothetical protein